MHFTEIEVEPAFLSSCKPTSESHAATICPEPPVTSKSVLVCSRTDTVIGDLEWRQQILFEGCETERRDESSIQETFQQNLLLRKVIGVHTLGCFQSCFTSDADPSYGGEKCTACTFWYDCMSVWLAVCW